MTGKSTTTSQAPCVNFTTAKISTTHVDIPPPTRLVASFARQRPPRWDR